MSNARELSKLVVGGEVSAGGVDDYADVNALPGNPSLGDLAFITGTNTLYVYNGSAWFNIAIANQAPTAISGNQASYVLAIDGTPTVVTLVSNDPEGFPLTWSATTSGDTQVGTLTNVDNVFTVTPSTDEADIGTLSVTFSVTDGNNTETSVSSFTLAFVSPLWDETVLSISTSSSDGLANSTFIDRSTNAHTFTKAGTPTQTSLHPYLDNWSVEFDGNDYLDVGSPVIPSSGDFTVEFWYMSIDLSHRNDIISQYTQSTDGRLAISQSSSTSVVSFFNSRSGSVVTTTIPKVGEWNHFAYVRDGDTFRAFVNGVQEATGTGSGTIDTATNTFIGFTPTQNYTEGYISDVRISSIARYDANGYAVPTEKLTADADTVLLTCQSNRFIDNSTNAHAITVNGDPAISAFNPFGQESEYAAGENRGSAKFGSGDSLTRATTGFYTVTSFCMEFWIYPLSDQSHYICEGTQQGSGTWRITIDSSGGGIGFSYAAGSWAGVNFSTGAGHFNSREWTHIAITKTSAGVYRIFINGVQQGTQTNTSSLINTARNFQFGYYVDGSGTSYSNALYSDFKITRQDPVYTSDFTVPTAPVGGTNVSINDPYMYLPMDNAGIFDKTGNNILTLTGNTATSTTQTKFADTAMYFDGNADYIRLQQDSNIILSPDQNFTVESWVWLSSLSNTMEMLCMFGPPHHSIAISLNRGGYGNTWMLLGNGSSWNGVPAIDTGGTAPLGAQQWHHVALVKNGSTITIYHDGQQAGQTTTSFTTTTGNLIIGAYELNGSFGEYLQGYIENFQVLKGVAKYTTNFTPPTKTQGLIYQAES